MRRSALALAGVCIAAASLLAAPPLLLPNNPKSLKFAVIGDNGTGARPEFEMADQMARLHQQFRYELVLMVGDNFYGSQRPADLEKKFAEPFRPLLDAGVTFQAALGNHDQVATIDYPPINMGGRRYYTYTRKNVRFFVLDSNVMDDTQLRWAESAMQQSA